MQLERLRLAGFKSFVEPTELTIGPGLTGIVGPNGCGKSNLVEALRWVMGEASARRLRGGEMDDVIFGGCGHRPARNLAEVALTLNNSSREAPFAFNESTTIEVTRRIVRGAGSTYRVNGREARARDVQLLFADAASGPHSGALVGQGRVGALVGAKPAERRTLLDEAAGTAGLHARRHEAELKFQAAEVNLARLDDVVATLAAQVETLNKQARQARRYRRLGEQIREAEARLLAARWATAAAESEALAVQLRAAERELAACVETASACERERGEADAALPPLRLAQASGAAAVQRLTHAREALEQELSRAVAARAEAGRRLAQVVADLAREADHLNDTDTMLTRLADERDALHRADAASVKTRADAAAQAEAAAVALAAAERGLQQMTEACATGEARRAALERQHRDLAERLRRLRSRLAEDERRRQPLLAASVPAEALADASAAVATASAAVEATRTASVAAAEAFALKQKREAEAADIAREAERVLAPLRAEADALTRLLPSGEAARAGDVPIVAQMRVPPGFEAATAALFDGELAAPQLAPCEPPATSKGAGWIELPPLAAAPLPDGAHPLADDLAAPAALTRRLAFAGWVETKEEGWRLQPHLAAGQCLVDREGRLWRWDGFARLTPGATATAEQLRQHNRLDQLAGEIAEAATKATGATAQAAAARVERDAAAAAERSAIAALRAAEDRLSRARNAEADLARRRLAAETQLAATNASVAKTAADLTETEQQSATSEQALARLPDLGLARSALDAARTEAAGARRRDGEARAALDRIERESEARRQRRVAIATDEFSWQKRRDSAAAQTAMLTERRAALDAEIAALEARPNVIAAESEALAQQASAAYARQREADDALAGAEARLRAAAEATRRTEAAVAEARERRAGLVARREAAVAGLAQLRAEIAERLGDSPENLAGLAVTDDPHAENLAARLDRLLRERDAMGPVNLLADREAEEVAGHLAGLERERTDLTEAIARLRRGIAALDREARARLIAAFERLNGHFGELFARLFGGGKAELAWAGGDDPLAAGLEILASPPGKRLDSLSLLSGGEQALTALALIFAVFLTNPAPVCVLDEVDAPLDDTNVDAFCRLVADIADTTGTRFLLVTHHRVTMARMDRLFGVTMAERGVSQLVSVDLARAAELRQSA